MNTLIEGKFGHGSIHQPIRRKIKKALRKSIVASTSPVNWDKGYDVRDTIGPITIKNQGTSSSCGGQAGSYFIEIHRRLNKLTEGAVSAKSIYAPIHYPNGGTTINDLERQIMSQGANLEASVPSYDAYGAPLSEIMMQDTSWQTDKTRSDAFTRAGYTPSDIADDIDTVAANISTWGAVLFEVKGQNGHIPSWLSSTPPAPMPSTGEPYWYHFMAGVGYKMINGKKAIICLQSWGNVGDNGVQYLTEDFFNGGGVVDAFTLIPNAQISPLPSNHSWAATVLRWWRALFKLPVTVN